jgi:hypothetical protein
LAFLSIDVTIDFPGGVFPRVGVSDANRVSICDTPVGSEADSPAPLLRPLPATGHDVKILGAYDPDLGYDAEIFPDKQTQGR